MNNAVVFLSASILYAIGSLIILVAIVVANNILHKYWKSFGWSFFPGWIGDSPRFANQEEMNRITPTMGDVDVKPSRTNS